jgi:hypothetical protein
MSHEEGNIARVSGDFMEMPHDDCWVGSRRENNPAQLTLTVEG